MDATDLIEQTPQMQAARQALAEAAKVATMPRPAYRQAVHQLPMLLQRHGLGQTLAYLQMRGDGRPTSPFNVLLRQLDRWLLASLAVSGPFGSVGPLRPRQPVLPRGVRADLGVCPRAPCGPGGNAMNWPWRMPRDLPWATPYPLPRDTSDAVLAEGRCENFGLLTERYLAFGDDRGQLRIVREMVDRKALVPSFAGQQELIEAHRDRWQHLAEELGAKTLSARPQWRVIVGKGTNALLEGGMTLHPVFGFPVVPATAPERRQPGLRPVGAGTTRGRDRYTCLGWRTTRSSCAVTWCFSKGSPLPLP